MVVMTKRKAVEWALTRPSVEQRIRAIQARGFVYNDNTFRYEVNNKYGHAIAWVNEEVVLSGL